MLITAVVTTYNRPELAKRAITSLLHQSYPDIEVIVVEDGANTGLDKWIETKHPNQIKYHNNKINKGLSASRNWAINNAKGSYIGFLDDDDEWKPDMVRETVKAIKALDGPQVNKTGAISSGTELKKNNEIVAFGYQKNYGNLEESIKTKGAFTLSSSSIYSVYALNKIGKFDESLKSSIDHDIWMALASGGFSVVAVNKPLVITHISQRIRLTTNPQHRLISLDLYLGKWLPTYQTWFGQHKGIGYANRYFAKVASNLAVSKCLSGEFGYSAMVTKSLFKKNPNLLQNMKYLIESFIRETIFNQMPPVVIRFLRIALRKHQAIS